MAKLKKLITLARLVTMATSKHRKLMLNFDFLTLTYTQLIITNCRAESCSQIGDQGGYWKLNFDDQVAVKYLVIYNVDGENGERIDGATVSKQRDLNPKF